MAKSLVLPEIKITKQLDPSKYIQVPNALGFRSSFRGKQRVPVISRVQEFNGIDFDNTHKAIYQDSGGVLQMSPPRIFIPHLINVSQAYYSNGEHKLHHSAGEALSDDEVKKLYKKIFTDSWIWLNASFKFRKEEGKLQSYLLTYYVGEDKEGNSELKSKESKLEKCLMDDMNDVNLNLGNFTKQGLPKQQKGLTQEDNLGKNICFYSPSNNSVARFLANSDRAGLYCDRNPSDSVDELGVFAYAEGVVETN